VPVSAHQVCADLKQKGEKMGIPGPFSRSSVCRDSAHQSSEPTRTIETRIIEKPVLVVGNPNPINFRILKMQEVGKFQVLLVKYTDCINYEGCKILVFEGATQAQLKRLKSMDPHFCNCDAHISPIARFKPTQKGWEYAVSFCENA
jgi:hypothetical protein